MERASLLISQARYDLAESELRRSLGADPDDAYAHGLLALCLVRRQQYAQATIEATESIRLTPDMPFSHYALAYVLYQRNEFERASDVVAEAIELDADDPDFTALLANIRIGQERWDDALEAAERGLALDPEHAASVNARAVALVRLRRQNEARDTVSDALARDPEDAYTHANQGWIYLHQADYDRALEHFREALRLDPDLEWARLGIIEALKARFLPYGLILRYFLWMSRLSPRTRWGVLIGAYVAYMVLGGLAATNPWLGAVVALYLPIALITWTASPIANLLLSLNRFGRLALSRDEKMQSSLEGICLLSAGVACVVGLNSGSRLASSSALFLGLLTIPVTATFNCDTGDRRRLMALLTAGIAAVGLCGIGLLLGAPTNPWGTNLLTYATWGAGLSSWIGNAQSQSPERR
jgi:tetratricopeptide (TPR) repeat protein